MYFVILHTQFVMLHLTYMYRHITLCHTLAELAKVPEPKVRITSRYNNNCMVYCCLSP
jgi:hypothetical protein